MADRYADVALGADRYNPSGKYNIIRLVSARDFNGKVIQYTTESLSAREQQIYDNC